MPGVLCRDNNDTYKASPLEEDPISYDIQVSPLEAGSHRLITSHGFNSDRRGHSVPPSDRSADDQAISVRRFSWQTLDTGSMPFLRLTNDKNDSYVRRVTKDASQAESNQDEAEFRTLYREKNVEPRSHSRKSPVKNHAFQSSLGTSYPSAPATLSDSNESEPSTVKISGPSTEAIICQDISSHHIGREIVNLVFSLPIDVVFTYLFTMSKFMVDLHQERKTYNLDASEWQSNLETNQKIRQVTYTLNLPTNSFGPKVSHVTETQVISAFSTCDEIYTVDAEACNEGIPYADYFSVCNHWCLTKEGPNETRLNVWAQVKYKKSVWGFMKAVIDKNAFSGVKTLLNDITAALVEEADRRSEKAPSSARRKRRRAGSKSSDFLVDSLPAQGDKNKDSHHKLSLISSRKTGVLPSMADNQRGTDESKGSMRSSALLFLCLLLSINAFLYYRLYSLEDKMVHGGVHRHSIAFDPNLFKRKEDIPVEEWVKILHEQEALHSTEVDRWKKAVSEAADYLKKAEESLRNLHSSIPQNQATKIQSLLRHLKMYKATDQNNRNSVEDKHDL